MSDFRLTIEYVDGRKARFRPGARSEEGQLRAAIVNRARQKGVGLFKTEAATLQALRRKYHGGLHGIKGRG